MVETGRIASGARWAIIAALSGWGCEYPTDKSDAVFVTVVAATESPSTSAVLLRGNRMVVRARAWQRGSAGDSIEVPNVTISWRSSAPARASVTRVDSRSAEVTGILAGNEAVAIEARADAFEASSPGVFNLRVADILEIDSVRPMQVRFGEQVTVHGVGIGGLIIANLDNTSLLPDTASFRGERFGLGSMRFWVPPPARSGQLFAVGPGVFVSAADLTTVQQFDLYEPNDSTPWTLSLDGAPPIPDVPAIKVVNPALAFEDLRADSVGYDWYRLSAASPDRPLTIIIDPPGQGGGNRTYLASANNAQGPPTSFDWAVGPGVLGCKGLSLAPRASPADQLVFAFARLPANAVDLVSEFLIEGAYSLMVVEGYLTTNAAIGPDRFEENDICDFADENFLTPGMGINLATPFTETLTIDNPFDVDWYRIRVPGPGPRQLTAAVAAPDGVDPTVIGHDAADLGLLLVTAPTPGLIGVTQQRDVSDETISTTVPPGDYYVVVMDQGGAPTPYGLCIAIAATCTPPKPVASFGGPAAPRSVADWVLRGRRVR